MYITEHIYGTGHFFETMEEAEADIAKNIDSGSTVVIAEVKKVFKTDPVPYRAVDVSVLQVKKLIEQDKESREEEEDKKWD